MASRGFTGDVAECYAKFRRGYPPAVVDELMNVLSLDTHSSVLDLGCGTGQLAIPLAARVRAVLGVDIEADMLRLARRAGLDAEAGNIGWMLGAETDLDALAPLLAPRGLDAVTIGNAIHLMDPPQLFRVLGQLVRPGGSVAVIANGTPLWLKNTEWSQRLRRHLEAWFGMQLTSSCGTDPTSRRKYERALAAAGFDQITETSVDYADELTFEQLTGALYSAMPADRLPRPDERQTFEHNLWRAVGTTTESFTEHVHVAILVGQGRSSA